MFVFVDESGELSNYTDSGSKYSVCTAVLVQDNGPIEALQELRHQIEQEGYPVPRGFHAKNDPYPRRVRVFQLLGKQPVYVHSVALKKEKVNPILRSDQVGVYRTAVRLLFEFLFEHHLQLNERHSIVVGTYGTGDTARRLEIGIKSIIEAYGTRHDTRLAFWEAFTHPVLQIADYCAWMTQRCLENPQQPQSQQLQAQMSHRIVTLFKPFD